MAEESFTRRITPGKVVTGVPAAGQEALLSQLRVGDMLDVLAVVAGENPTSGTVLRRAVVMREGSRSSGGLLLEVTPEESLALAHLIGRGARLTYALYPSGSVSPVPLGG